MKYSNWNCSTVLYVTVLCTRFPSSPQLPYLFRCLTPRCQMQGSQTTTKDEMIIGRKQRVDLQRLNTGQGVNRSEALTGCRAQYSSDWRPLQRGDSPHWGVPVAEAKRVRRDTRYCTVRIKLWALLEPLSDSTVLYPDHCTSTHASTSVLRVNYE